MIIRISCLLPAIVAAVASVCVADSGDLNQTALLNGHWRGSFVRMNAVQELRLDFESTDSGLIGYYDIPEMILFHEPITDLAIENDTINLRLFWGTFRCILNEKYGEITGLNKKWNPEVALHVKKALPSPPVAVETVHFQSDSLQLEGSLILPSGEGPFPAMVIVEGSTIEGRSSWMYRSYGYLLAQFGVAALLYDKRGTGASEGDFDVTTIQDLGDDAVSAVNYLAGCKQIDQNRIGLFGISQGGWIVPMAAAQSDKIAFAIIFSGPAVSIWDQELDAVEYGMKAGANGESEPDQFNETQIEEAIQHTKLGFEVCLNSSLWPEWIASVEQARQSEWSQYVGLDTVLSDLQDWLRYRYDPAADLKKLNIPLLAIYGADDYLVPPVENVPLLKSYLAEGGNNDAAILIFPEVGHDLITGSTLVGDEWDWPGKFWMWNGRAHGLADSILTWTENVITAR